MANKIKKEQMLKGLGIGVAAGIIVLVVFLAGVFVGRRENGFFLARMRSFPGGIVARYGHGAIGTIDSIGKNTFVIKTRSDEIETVLTDNKTVYRKYDSDAKFSDLKKSDRVIVIGEPQEKEEAIKATFVRIVNEL